MKANNTEKTKKQRHYKKFKRVYGRKVQKAEKCCIGVMYVALTLSDLTAFILIVSKVLGRQNTQLNVTGRLGGT
jgi:hypothetical protein